MNLLHQQNDLLGRAVEKHRKDIKKAEDLKYKLTDNNQIRVLKPKIAKAYQELEKMENALFHIQALLNDVKFDIQNVIYTIILFDGSEFTTRGAIVSDKYNLAILEMEESECPCLEYGNSDDLNTGQPVYTIGSPAGMSFTVTSGVISSGRLISGIKYIQTDDPINHGNSGGPLIDENGKVIGMNTILIQGTEGIGLAIAINPMLEEIKAMNLR